MTVDVGLAPREGGPWTWAAGTCYACPDHPDGHPLVGDPFAHLRAVGYDDGEVAEIREEAA